MIRPRLVLAAASFALILLVLVVGTALGPDGARRWLIFSGLLATIAAAQSAASDPRDLSATLLLSLPPVIALLADGSPTWLIGPLAALLLAAAEFNALAWACQGADRMSASHRHRLRSTGWLTALAMTAALMIGVLTTGQ